VIRNTEMMLSCMG